MAGGVACRFQPGVEGLKFFRVWKPSPRVLEVASQEGGMVEALENFEEEAVGPDIRSDHGVSLKNTEEKANDQYTGIQAIIH